MVKTGGGGGGGFWTIGATRAKSFGDSSVYSWCYDLLKWVSTMLCIIYSKSFYRHTSGEAADVTTGDGATDVCRIIVFT